MATHNVEASNLKVSDDSKPNFFKIYFVCAIFILEECFSMNLHKPQLKALTHKTT